MYIKTKICKTSSRITQGEKLTLSLDYLSGVKTQEKWTLFFKSHSFVPQKTTSTTHRQDYSNINLKEFSVLYSGVKR